MRVRVGFIRAVLSTGLASLLFACGGGGGGGSATAGGSGSPALDPAVADLGVQGLHFAPASARAGEALTVSDTVANLGSGPADAFRVGLYLSADAALDAGDVLLGFRTVPGLAPGAVSTGGGQVTVPASTVPGVYRLVVRVDADEQVAETDEENNTLVAATWLEVLPTVLPDLVPQAVDFAVQSVASGETVTVTDVVENRGTSAAGAFQIGIYLSADAVLTPQDVRLGVRALPSLDAGASSQGAGPVTIPSSTPAGLWWIGVIVDDQSSVVEADELGNALLATHPLEVVVPPRPDLLVTAAQWGGSGHVESGQTVPFDDTVANLGEVAAGPFEVGVYLSEDALVTTTDRLVGTRVVAGLAAGEASEGAGVVTIPVDTPAGSWTLGAIADHLASVGESAEENNVRVAPGTLQVTVPPRPDLVVETITVSPDVVEPALGELLHVSHRVANRGDVASGLCEVGVYLSTNGVVSTGDVRIGTLLVDHLAPGETRTAEQELLVPATVSAGSYYLGVLVDAGEAIVESDETNNALVASGTVDVVQTPDPMPNLVVESVAFGPVSLAPGEPVQVQSLVRNLGDLSAGSFRVGVYLSADDAITTDDVLLGTRSVSQLAIGFGSAASTPYAVPADTPDGNWYVGVVVDDQGTVLESDEEDNTLRANGTLAVVAPPPPAPDLTITGLDLSPTTAAPGTTLHLVDGVRNGGDLPAGGFRIQYYLSADAELDPAVDLLLGLRDVGGLAAGEETTTGLDVTLPAGVASGTWRVGAIIDVLDAVPEANENDNHFLAPEELSVP